jgi:hypothetical protein
MASRGNCKKEGLMLSSLRAIVSTGTAPQSAARSWASSAHVDPLVPLWWLELRTLEWRPPFIGGDYAVRNW